MTNQKTEKLIYLLDKKTKQGELDWAETEKKNVYQSSFPNYSVRLGETVTLNSMGSDYYLQIIDSSGEIVETVKGADLSFSPAHSTLVSLYDDARRIAKGVEKALDDLLSNLEDDFFDEDIPF